MSDQNILDKSIRSVFVGNIPYEATEEKLKDIFNEVGPVISFKLVYDRETGKPKGYGFCEFKDQETALSAMRNLNGYEISGRSLRVDNACTEKSRLEMQSLMMAMPNSESHYGDAVNADEAPEIISSVIASLPQEQLFELLRQMKDCIQNNPVEARNMLLQNPQLGYALLQATVVTKTVNPETALTMLYSAHKVPPTLNMSSTASTSRTQPTPEIQNNNLKRETPNPLLIQPRPDNIEWNHINNVNGSSQNVSQVSFNKPPSNLPVKFSQSLPGLRDYTKTSIMDSDNRSFRDIHNHMPNNNSFMTMPPFSIPTPEVIRSSVTLESQLAPRGITSNQSQAPKLPSKQPVTSDSEKANLIMQVLQLTDSQIAMLPSEQQQNIIQVKEKIVALSSQKKN